MRQTALRFIAAVVGLAQSPMFYKDVAPVLEQHCHTCRRPGEVAPMRLPSYSDVRPWAKAIKTAVLSHKVPPWYADPHVGTFSSDPTLKQAEIDVLVKWTDGGAPKGNPSDATEPRKFAEGWTIGKPDQVFGVGTDFKVPAKGTIEHTYFVVPTGFMEDKWVKDTEVRPENSAVVHHVVLYARLKGSKFIAEAKPAVPYVPTADPDRATSGRPRAIRRGCTESITALMKWWA